MHKYLVPVLVVLLHARFSVVGPIPFLLAAIFFPGHPYIGSTTVFPDICFVSFGNCSSSSSFLHRSYSANNTARTWGLHHSKAYIPEMFPGSLNGFV